MRSMPRRWPEREIARLAARQHALITFRQLIAMGVTRGSLSRAFKRGRLYRPHRGVYAVVPPQLLPPLAHEHAAVLACGEGAAVAHASAAGAWGMRPHGGSAVDVVVMGHERGRTLHGIRIHRTSNLHACDIWRRQHIPITSPTRTLLDVAPSLTIRELERTLDDAIARGIFTRSALLDMLDRYPRHKGAARLRAICSTTTLTRSTGTP